MPRSFGDCQRPVVAGQFRDSVSSIRLRFEFRRCRFRVVAVGERVEQFEPGGVTAGTVVNDEQSRVVLGIEREEAHELGGRAPVADEALVVATHLDEPIGHPVLLGTAGAFEKCWRCISRAVVRFEDAP